MEDEFICIDILGDSVAQHPDLPSPAAFYGVFFNLVLFACLLDAVVNNIYLS